MPWKFMATSMAANSYAVSRKSGKASLLRETGNEQVHKMKAPMRQTGSGEIGDRRSLNFQVSLHGPQLFFIPKFSAFPNIVSLPLFVAFQSPLFKFNLSEWVTVSQYLKKSH